MRAAFVLSLIAALLICPYRCMGSVGSSAQEEPAARCSCCSHEEPAADFAVEWEQGDRKSSVPAEDCWCGNCLCHGAVRGDDDVSTDEILKASEETASLPRPVTLAVSGQEFGEQIQQPIVSPSHAGRTLRLAIQSLQI